MEEVESEDHQIALQEVMQVADAAQAWCLGRERYPHCIRGVVRRDAWRDGSEAEPSKRR